MSSCQHSNYRDIRMSPGAWLLLSWLGLLSISHIQQSRSHTLTSSPHQGHIWSTTHPCSWVSDSWHAFLSSRKEDGGVARETWLSRIEGVPEHRAQEQARATSSLKMSKKLFAIKSSKDLKTSLKTQNLSHSKALNQLKQLKLI